MDTVLVFYFVFINLAAAVICAADKIKAIKGKRRISERTLWVLSAVGGSVGMYLTMRIIRHKTLHLSFMIGLPVMIIIQIAIVLLLTNAYARHIMA